MVKIKLYSFKEVINIFYSISLIILLYNGDLKWIFTKIDPGILFGSISVVLFPLIYKLNFNNNIYKFNYNLLKYLFFLHLIILGSILYTASSDYYKIKGLKIALNLAVFVLAYIIFSRKILLQYFISLHYYLWVLTIIGLIYLFATSGLNLFWSDSETAQNFVTYSAASVFLGSNILLFFDQKKGLFNWLLFLSSFVFMIVLAAKGPLLILLIILLFKYLETISLKRVLKLFFVLFSFILILIQFEDQLVIYDRLLSRVNNGENIEQNESYTERKEFINQAYNVIITNPIIGSGLASYGILVNHKEGKASPHNIFVEVLFETGILGISLMITFIFKVYYQYKKAKLNIKNTNLTLVIFFLISFTLISGIFEDLMIVYFWLGLFLTNIGNLPENNKKHKICVV